jgi:hypothetical protein
MTGEQLAQARKELGRLWGLQRPVRPAELGRALQYRTSDPGESIRIHESQGAEPIPGPVAAAVRMMLSGALPPGGIGAHLTPKKRRPRRRRVIAAQ